MATLITVGSGLLGSGEGRLFLWLLLAPNVLGVAALVAVLGTEMWSRSLQLPSLVVLLWATTSFGLLQAIGDYALMVTLSGANWDTPPGSGYAIVAGIALAALVLLATTYRRVRLRRQPPVSHLGRPVVASRPVASSTRPITPSTMLMTR